VGCGDCLPLARRSRSRRERSVAVIAIVWSPMKIEIRYGDHEPGLLSQSLTGSASTRLALGAARRQGAIPATGPRRSQLRCNDVARSRFGGTPWGVMGKREPQTIDDRSIHLEDRGDGKFTAKSAGCGETRVFLDGDKSKSR
jgi:hypothetical protein